MQQRDADCVHVDAECALCYAQPLYDGNAVVLMLLALQCMHIQEEPSSSYSVGCHAMLCS